MTVRRLAAVDAQTYWMSAKIPNDQFLLYGFEGGPRISIRRSTSFEAGPTNAQSCGCGFAMAAS